MNKKIIFILVCYFVCALKITAQISSEQLKQFLNTDTSIFVPELAYPKQVKQFYIANNFNTSWFQNKNNSNILINLLNKSKELGLNKEDYQHNFLQSFYNHTYSFHTITDSILAELRFTDAAIHFCRDVVYGNTPPKLDYNGLKYNPDCFDLSATLLNNIKQNRLQYILNDIESKSLEYSSIKNKITQFNKILNDTSFKEIVISSKQINTNNIALIDKLYQLGFLDSVNQKINTNQLVNKLKAAQKFLALTDNGILTEETIKTLNVSLVSRVEELKLALNTTRWLQCIKQNQTIIVVNIPSANLLVYKDGKVILESRVIVGKKSTATPTQCSKITEVILNPRWTVPYKIATKEMLPIIQKNIDYLEKNNFEVLDEYGEILDPLTIDWASLTAKNFPYTLRQSSGEGNALGIIKFNFYNPYNTYLHDTPQRGLFKRNKRYFSHGCMRVEKVTQLKQLLLSLQTLKDIDKFKQKDSLYNQAPTFFSVKEKMPVFILYNTAWIDAEGKVCFYEDIYEKFSSL